MNQTIFLGLLEEELHKQILEPVRIGNHKIRKNNGRTIICLTILPKGKEASPAIAVEPFFQKWREGWSINRVAEDVIETWREASVDERLKAEDFTDYGQVKDRLFCMVINREKNREILEEQPWEPFLDLAVVCYYRVEEKLMEAATIRITDQHLKLWGITKEELFIKAKENSFRNSGGKCYSMTEILGISEGNIPLYVVTNENRYLGAAAILEKQLLKQVGDRLDNNFFVLPSSIHECLILPDSGQFSKQDLINMVQEVNQTQVEAEEVLSDLVYYYDRRTAKLVL